MSNITINLPLMPNPKDFGSDDPKRWDGNHSLAVFSYMHALEAWKDVCQKIINSNIGKQN